MVVITSKSAGGVVLNKRGQVLVVNQRGKSWSLPKGHIEKGEEPLEAARREIHEESGLADLKYIRPLGSYERHRIGLSGGENRGEKKHLTFFLFEANGETLKPLDPDNPEARWVDRDKAAEILTHPKDREFLIQVLQQI
jgi:ADP-ribose pyrophosphatase YjhB (NUDIX family)